VLLPNSVIKLITGSPAWVSLPIEVTEPIDTLSFDYAYQRQAEGLLSVFFDNQLVFRSDERVEPAGANHSDNVSIGAIASGTHTLSFRLDAYNNTQSEIDISHIQLGKMEISNVQNQPPIANAGPNQTVRLSSLVTLNSSASVDPDQGPSPLSFAWTQPTGLAVALTGANSAKSTFTPTVKGTYTFSLTVNDGQANSVPALVTLTVPALGDLNNDGVIDQNDVNIVTAARNTPANGPNDLRDLNGDLKIDALDARTLVTLCTRPRCATQ
jgi:hypothetical protein